MQKESDFSDVEINSSEESSTSVPAARSVPINIPGKRISVNIPKRVQSPKNEIPETVNEKVDKVKFLLEENLSLVFFNITKSGQVEQIFNQQIVLAKRMDVRPEQLKVYLANISAEARKEIIFRLKNYDRDNHIKNIMIIAFNSEDLEAIKSELVNTQPNTVDKDSRAFLWGEPTESQMRHGIVFSPRHLSEESNINVKKDKGKEPEGGIQPSVTTSTSVDTTIVDNQEDSNKDNNAKNPANATDKQPVSQTDQGFDSDTEESNRSLSKEKIYELALKVIEDEQSNLLPLVVKPSKRMQMELDGKQEQNCILRKEQYLLKAAVNVLEQQKLVYLQLKNSVNSSTVYEESLDDIVKSVNYHYFSLIFESLKEKENYWDNHYCYPVTTVEATAFRSCSSGELCTFIKPNDHTLRYLSSIYQQLLTCTAKIAEKVKHNMLAPIADLNDLDKKILEISKQDKRYQGKIDSGTTIIIELDNIIGSQKEQREQLIDTHQSNPKQSILPKQLQKILNDSQQSAQLERLILDVNDHDEQQLSLLNSAITNYQGNNKSIELLLEYGAEVFDPDSKGNTAFGSALQQYKNSNDPAEKAKYKKIVNIFVNHITKHHTYIFANVDNALLEDRKHPVLGKFRDKIRDMMDHVNEYTTKYMNNEEKYSSGSLIDRSCRRPKKERSEQIETLYKLFNRALSNETESLDLKQLVNTLVDIRNQAKTGYFGFFGRSELFGGKLNDILLAIWEEIDHNNFKDLKESKKWYSDEFSKKEERYDNRNPRTSSLLEIDKLKAGQDELKAGQEDYKIKQKELEKGQEKLEKQMADNDKNNEEKVDAAVAKALLKRDEQARIDNAAKEEQARQDAITRDKEKREIFEENRELKNEVKTLNQQLNTHKADSEAMKIQIENLTKMVMSMQESNSSYNNNQRRPSK